MHLIADKYRESDFVVIGDYNNLPGLSWTNSSTVRYGAIDDKECRVTTCADIIKNGYSFLDMNQFFPVPHYKPYTLDLFFTHLSNVSAYTATECLVPIDDHHIPHSFNVEIDLNCTIKNSFGTSKMYDFAHADYDEISEHLADINWEDIFSNSDDVDWNLQDFYNTIGRPIDEFTPLKKFHGDDKSSYPTWYSNELISLIIDEEIRHINWKRTGIDSNYIEFKRLRDKCIR
ncbi:hypothetical protein QAD02_003455 [Eretmocerus hayati]|uniref:Uncharacterized protein n=1 Tax=Eretmocerus hayati TaxID=131215 RepID=A0ACC2NMR2_9HYME|nr:hypothetical protein QAD02_003455 [Eretmocerus hayati]